MRPPYGPLLRQPDQRSCGASCVVVARMLRATRQDREPTAASFARDVLDTHRRLVRPVDADGRAQVPWPRALGTPPWAVARALATSEGVGYRTVLARWSRSSAFDRTAAAVRHHPVALFIGSARLPRHVVLAVSGDGQGLTVYDPASGGLTLVNRDAFRAPRVGVAGWDVPWFVVLPR